MLQRNGLPNRRQFLERSMLGFGSAFLLPSLLTSCTDHRIPPDDVPDWPYTDWPYTGPLGSIDWNNTAKALVITGLGLIPEVGGLLGGLTGIFWPDTKEDVWGEVKNYVEQVIDQKIADDVYGRVSANLQGLEGVIKNYLNAINDKGDIKTYWIVLRTDFSLYLPNFQQAGYELPLLPLFAQFANMYLALLRDGVVFGASWGMPPGEVQQAATDLTKAISDLTTYATNWYKLGQAVKMLTPVNYHYCEPFRTVNAYNRQLITTVLDYRDTWYAFDVTLYPNGTTVTLTREIYTDPMGAGDDIATKYVYPIVIPTPVPTQRPSRIAVWGDERIFSTKVWYPAGSGPGGVTETPIMGGPGGYIDAPYGGYFELAPDNPITGVQVHSSDFVSTFQFTFHDGSVTDVFGGRTDPDRQTLGTVWSFPLEALSSIYVPTTNDGTVNIALLCIVFGFQYWQPPTATLNALRLLYVRSPNEKSAADFAKAFPKLAIPANLITDAVRAARRKHWESIKARANKPK